MEGKGTMKYFNGDVYEGGWIEDKKHGKGIMKYSNNDVYEGDWWFIYGKHVIDVTKILSHNPKTMTLVIAIKLPAINTVFIITIHYNTKILHMMKNTFVKNRFAMRLAFFAL
jgi:hypothetical protein